MDLNGLDLAKAVLSVSFASEKKSANSLYYFVKPKDLQLTKPNIQISKIDELTYEISTDVLAKNVFLSAEEDAFFSDNYFDMEFKKLGSSNCAIPNVYASGYTSAYGSGDTIKSGTYAISPYNVSLIVNIAGRQCSYCAVESLSCCNSDAYCANAKGLSYW